MNKRLILLVVLVAVLVLGTAVVAYAGSARKITGAMKAEYGEGWNWMQVNIHVSPSGEARGFMNKYRSYTEEPNDWSSWRGEPVCVSFGEFEGMPAAAVVGRFTESSDEIEIPVGWYSKGLYVDGGKNARSDLIGLIVWPPVEEKPNCDFEDAWYWWSGVGGNITIH